MTKKSAKERDDEVIGRAQRRAVRAYKHLRKFGGWRAVGSAYGIGHGNVVALVKHGRVPRNESLRLALGLPLVLPSEREQRTRGRRTEDGMETMTIEQYRELLERNGGKSKYGNVKTEVDGFVFASGAEARRYGELKMLEQAGEISELQLQVAYHLDVNGVHVCDYVADFVYQTTEDGGRRTVVEDVKGKKTKEYRLKKKLMEAVHGVTIVEVSR